MLAPRVQISSERLSELRIDVAIAECAQRNSAYDFPSEAQSASIFERKADIPSSGSPVG